MIWAFDGVMSFVEPNEVPSSDSVLVSQRITIIELSWNEGERIAFTKRPWIPAAISLEYCPENKTSSEITNRVVSIFVIRSVNTTNTVFFSESQISFLKVLIKKIKWKYLYPSVESLLTGSSACNWPVLGFHARRIGVDLAESVKIS